MNVTKIKCVDKAVHVPCIKKVIQYSGFDAIQI